MKYLFIIILNLFLLIYLIIERLCKIIIIIFVFVWEFKKFDDYSFWKEIHVYIGYGFYFKTNLNDYFINPFKNS